MLLKKGIFYIFLLLFFHCTGYSQRVTDTKASVKIIRSIRHVQNTNDARDIIKEVIQRKNKNTYTSLPYVQYNRYQKTSIDFVGDKNTLMKKFDLGRKKHTSFFDKYIAPFEEWLEYAREIPGTEDMALTTLLYEDYNTGYEDNIKEKRGMEIHASRHVGFFETIGQQNILYFLNEMFGEIDLYQNKTQMMLLEFENPLSDNALELYEYGLTGTKNIAGKECFEIVFHSNNDKENAFAGYLYVNITSYALLKAVFTINSPNNMNFLQDVLFTQTYVQTENNFVYPEKKESSVVLGDEVEGCISLTRVSTYSGFKAPKEPFSDKIWKNTYDSNFKSRDSLYWDSTRTVPLTPAQTQIDELVKVAPNNSVFTMVQDVIIFLLSSHVTIGGINGKVELGPVLQFLSYNEMEGVRLKVGGNTTANLFNKLLLGGYVAYGTKDNRWKYRGDLIYSFLPRDRYIWEYPKQLLSFSYVSDLNIPGQDLLNTNRDNIVYSLSHASTNNMSLQKIGKLTFENENKHNFSYSVGAKYLNDEPVGIVKYMEITDTGSGLDTTVINNLKTTEFAFSFRYSPKEKFIQNRDKRIPIRRGDVELKLEHRIGIKGVFGSEYDYQITDFNMYKKVALPNNTGNVDLRFSGGMVWNRVPFPLLFIPIGNQSYIYQAENYNCMNFYEFTTDRYLSGNVGMIFNWSPFKWFSKNSKVKMTLGTRIIYGPLSDKNNPAYHSDLFVFNEGVKPLERDPYAEINMGFANIFKILRLEYVRRLTYLQDGNTGGNELIKGSLLFTCSFAF